jgi:class 3 adenylate cyclase
MAGGRVSIRVLRRLGTVWGGAIAFAVLLVLAWAAVLAVGHRALAARMAEIIWPAAGLVAVAASWRTARSAAVAPRVRRAWLFFAAGFTVNLTGDAIYTALTFGGRTAPFPSLADPFYLALYPLVLIGLLHLPTQASHAGGRIRVFLDLATVLVGVTVVLWDALLYPFAARHAGTSLALVVAAGNPVGDLVVLAGITAVLVRRPAAATGGALLWLFGGLVLYAASDLAYSASSLDGTYQVGGLVDIGWLVAPVLYAIAALRQISEQQAGTTTARASAMLERGALLVPVLAAATGFALILRIVANHALGLGRLASVVGATTLCALVLVRQIVTAVQNARLSRELAARNELLNIERDKSERLLLSILPAPIADQLREAQPTAAIAEQFDEVTVLFADLVGFTPLAATMSPAQLVALLDEVFSRFDDVCARHGLEKIKTIGDAYMAASGVPIRRADHASRGAHAALELRDALAQVAASRGVALQVRIGMSCGPVVAGVIGRQKFAYDLWGDTVNTASRMESHGVPGAIHVSSELEPHLAAGFELEVRGEIEVKGKGRMRTLFVRGVRMAS